MIFSNKNKIVFTLSVFCLIVFNSKVFSQSLVTIPSTVELPLESKINKFSYNLHIALPFDYEKSKQSYPVIYVLDANNDFPLVTSISRRLQAEEELKDLIIVGISYKDSAYINRRADYTPSSLEAWGNSGGASKFISVIQDEVFPIIETKFRVEKDSRTLFGHSLGGLLGSYLLVNGQELFNNYIISSPSMWWDDYYVLKNGSSSSISSKVFLSVGALERPHMLESCNKLSSFIDENIKSASKKVVILDGENHASAKIRAYTDGLKWLFK
ncbi:alpha/beta hydrolase-fold protein [Pontimicrobium sp. SW4]|uniref:Alpha/beta hydrolase-fold protein n=1 Tax=Pontimicrobium sp. SW4 TaxID=3153519 RepID=A0AAU7BPH3_9FLAO